MSGKEKQLLIVEDDEGLQSQLKWAFEDYDVLLASNRDEAISLLRRYEPGVVLCDLGLPPDPGGCSEGFATLEQILSLAPDTRVIVITGDDDRSNAVKAIGLGAYDFYQKPVDPSILTLIADRAYHVHYLERANRELLEGQLQIPLQGIIATSPQMLKVCRTVEKVAPSNITTLIVGDSGTGKERIAQALHDLSPRSNHAIVAINCAAIPANLLESELFGYEKGAFTGAARTTLGKIELADGGTLFLDEIGDLPLELQPKLLRFLQERVIERVGGRKEIPVDVRIVCATHQDLQQQIDQGAFRQDLFYRISELVIDIPSLRDRDGDVLILAKAFMSRFNEEHGTRIKGFDKEAIAALEAFDWPGNVRELESRVKRAVIMAEGSYINSEDLQLTEPDANPMPFNLREVREGVEKKAVSRALIHCDNNISEAASLLGITRPTLYNLLEKLGLKSDF